MSSVRKIVRVLRRDQRRAERDDQDQHECCEAGERKPACGEIGRDTPERRFGDCSGGVHVWAPVRRTRGSSSEYSRSTTRLMITNMKTMIST